uniref:C-type lectin domain-containing protein n=1 Tax=Panagrolaimus sp. ES5 TaxID=591445 RepID=A0AC34FNV1_9BILA
MTSITPALADCKWGWEYFDYTKSYYCFSGDGFTSSPTEEFFSWQDGENFCKTLGGHLASVHDKTEFDYFFYSKDFFVIKDKVL